MQKKFQSYENCSLVAILTKEFGSALRKPYYLFGLYWLVIDYLCSPGGFSGVHHVFVRFRPSHCAGVPQSPWNIRHMANRSKKCLHVRALLTQIFTTGGLSFRIDAILTFFMCCRKRNMWMQREDQFCFSIQSIISQNVSKLFCTLALDWPISDSQNYHRIFQVVLTWPWLAMGSSMSEPSPPSWLEAADIWQENVVNKVLDIKRQLYIWTTYPF